MKNFAKRLCSAALCLCILAGVLPVTAAAAQSISVGGSRSFSATSGTETEFEFTTGNAGLYRFDCADTDGVHGGKMRLYSGSTELSPYVNGYMGGGEKEPEVSYSWKLSANTAYRLVHTPDPLTDNGGTHSYNLTLTYEGGVADNALHENGSVSIDFVNSGAGGDTFYSARFNLSVSTTGLYRLTSAKGSSIAQCQLPAVLCFQSGVEYELYAYPKNAAKPEYGESISLAAASPDYVLTETAPVTLGKDLQWVAFTANASGTYDFLIDGTANLDRYRRVNDKDCFSDPDLGPEFGEWITGRSIAAGETVYFQVLGAFGKMTVTKTGEAASQPVADGSLQLVSTSPKSGTVGFSWNDVLEMTFSEDISESLDWSCGGIHISYYNNEETIISVTDQQTFEYYGGKVSGESLYFGTIFKTLYGMKYYVTVDPGVIYAKKPSSNGELNTFSGISDKDAFMFEAKYFGTDFKMGRDSFSFTQEASETFNNKYYLSDLDYEILEDKLPRYIVPYFIRDLFPFLQFKKPSFTNFTFWDSYARLYEDAKEHNGACFGISSAMALFYMNELSVKEFDKDASIVYEIKKPNTDSDFASMLTYYNMLQYTSEMESEDSDKSQKAMTHELIASLRWRDRPVLVNFKMDYAGDDLQHSVLAIAVNEDFSDDFYIVYVADPNVLTIRYSSEAEEPSFLLIKKRTNQPYLFRWGRPNSLSFDVNGFVSIFSNYAAFDEYNLERLHAEYRNK